MEPLNFTRTEDLDYVAPGYVIIWRAGRRLDDRYALYETLPDGDSTGDPIWTGSLDECFKKAVVHKTQKGFANG